MNEDPLFLVRPNNVTIASVVLINVVAFIGAIYFALHPERIGVMKHISLWAVIVSFLGLATIPYMTLRHIEFYNTHIIEKPSISIGPITHLLLRRSLCIPWGHVVSVEPYKIPNLTPDPARAMEIVGIVDGREKSIRLGTGKTNYEDAVLLTGAKVPREMIDSDVCYFIDCLRRDRPDSDTTTHITSV